MTNPASSTPRVCVVTGSSGPTGIGAATARHIVRQGRRVIKLLLRLQALATDQTAKRDVLNSCG